MVKLGADIHSYANFQQIRCSHLYLSLSVDFTRKIFHGYVDLDFKVLEDNVKEILLDSKNLAIERVEDRDAPDAAVLHTLPTHHPALGIALRIPIDKEVKKDSEVHYRVYYSTTPSSAGIQWFEPAQTAGKKHPYVYTQGEAILARTLLPCQDTPSVKAPYDIKVTCPSPLVVACSGAQKAGPVIEDDGRLSYEFTQVNPIPAYLIAIVCGALKRAPIGPRSHVWTEKEYLDAAVHEFSEDTEKFITTGENITGVPYEWGLYDVVVLPGAFPYGGMENPNLTFLSASLLAGDRSLTNVVAHEVLCLRGKSGHHRAGWSR